MRNEQIDSQEMITSLSDEYDSIILRLEAGDVEIKDATLQTLILVKEFLSRAQFGDAASSLQKSPFDLDRILDHLNGATDKKEKTSERNYNLGCLAFLLKQYGASELQAHKALAEWLPETISCKEQTIRKAQEKFEKEAYVPKGVDPVYFLDLYMDKAQWVLGQVHAPFPGQYKKAHDAYLALCNDLEILIRQDGSVNLVRKICG